MAGNEGFGGDHLTGEISFSQLLLAEDDGDVAVGLDVDRSLNYSVFSSGKPPKMLCFGNCDQQEAGLVYPETTRTPQKSGVTCSDSSTSSSNNGSINTLSKSVVKKRIGSGQESVQCTNTITPAVAAGQRTSKKKKMENPTPVGHAKRKEKLGERVAALQQLVSPFGKTDTASVLHEAMGYIRFLHEQVQVLCSPYLQRLRSSPELRPLPDDGENGEEARKDLRSRGLCLVPVECTVHVANGNGADFWSPAALGSKVTLSTKQ
ncbi:transcription factor bHLH113 [Juglans microcarpa x Juglans regia]|uniref:transcription factor bHLH113 n=1 Tax=Juglans microcarpa x Juglans regia TaxID=2249226 RepID=UPI001B7DF863|nr:transcription factor bHLH113 [Juglans microcarpa x Juglans regia]